MSSRLHILIIADREDHADLIICELRRANPNADYQRVETEKDFLTALDTLPDLILSDYRLREFDGAHALAILADRQLDIPFIFVSAATSEEIAIEAIKQGVSDVVTTGCLARLGPAVKNALDKKRMRDEKERTDARLRRAETRLAIMLAQAAEAIIVVNNAHRIIVFNQAAVQMFGYAAEELMGQPFDLLLPERFIEIHRDHMSQFVASPGKTRGVEKRRELWAKRKDGTEFPVEVGISQAMEDGEQIYTAMIVDITERQRTEQALRESEERYRLIADNMTDTVWVADLSLNPLYISPSAARVRGYTLDELKALSLEEQLTPASLEVAMQTLGKELAAENHPHTNKNRIRTLELEYYCKDGSTIWSETRLSFVRDSDGQASAILGVGRDISERKRAEQALRDSEERHRTLFESVPIGLYRTTPDGAILQANSALVQMLGYPDLESLVAMNARDIFVDPKDRERENDLLETMGLVQDFEVQMRRRDKSVIWVADNVRPIWDDRGQMLYYDGSLRDITGRKRAEEELRESEERYRAATEVVSDYAYAYRIDAQGNTGLEWVTDAYERITGYSPDETSADGAWQKLIYPDDLTVASQHVASILSGKASAVEYRIVTKDGKVRWLSDTAQPMWSETENRVLRVYGAARDITERKLAEQAEREQRNLAEALRDTAAALSRTLIFEELLDHILINANKVVPHDSSSIMLVEDGIARVVRGYGFERFNAVEAVLNLRLNVNEVANLREAAATKQPITVSDTLNDPDWIIAVGTEWMRSNICAPIMIKGEVIGFLNLGSAATDHFKSAHAAALQAFADQAAVALENARLLEHTRKRAEEFAALYETTRELTAQTELPTLLETIVERATNLLATTFGIMYLVDPARGDLELVAVKGYPLEVGKRFRIDQGMAGHIMRTRKPMIVNDYGHWEYRRPELEGLGLLAALQVPVLYRGELIGVLGVAEVENSTRKFSDEDGQWLTLFASQAASAVLNARSLVQSQRRAHEFEALFDTSRDLALQTDVPTLLDTIVERATALLKTAHGFIYLYDDRGNDLVLTIAKNFPAALGTRVALVEGIAGRVAQTQQVQIVEDYQVWQGRTPKYAGFPFRAVVEVPMLAAGELIGVLGVNEYGESTRRFTEEDARLLSVFAGHAASIVRNTRLLEETRRRAEQLATLNEIGKAVSAQLDLETVLETIYRQVQRILSLDVFYVALYDRKTNMLSFPLMYDEGRRYAQPSTPVTQGARVSRTLEKGEAILLNRSVEELGANDNTTVMVGNLSKKSASLMYVPLRYGAWTIGLMSAQSYTLNAYSEEHLSLLNHIASQVAITIENARLFRETESNLLRVQALHQIDRAISSSLDLNVTLNTFLTHVTVQLGVDAGDVLVLNPNTQMLEFAGGMGFRTTALQHTRLRLGDGFAGKVALEREIVSVLDLPNEIDGLARSESIQAEGFVSYYGVPLVAKGRVNGVLEVFHRAPIEANQNWLDFLQTLAGQAAIAIDNAMLFGNLQRMNLDLSLAYDATIQGWSNALDLRDKETQGHTLRVTELTLRLARAMGMSETELVHLRRGALLHDIGKMGVPDAVLFKPDKLNDEEWCLMRRHPEFAFQMLSPIAYLKPALDIPYCHHEKWDGTGYPRGLQGEQIPLAARIFALADVWDAMSSNRPYRPALPEFQVREYIQAEAGKHFDPRVVEAFLKIMQEE